MDFEEFEKIEANEMYYVNSDMELFFTEEYEADEYKYQNDLTTNEGSWNSEDWIWMNGEDLLKKLLKEKMEYNRVLYAQNRQLNEMVKRLAKGE